ncbi:MAG TPA: hypothetical protein VL588_10315, partial [Bdellovibrionota bacterium]|nr:hypothetical protein [Bdellovibrionota bacterium]
MPLRLRITRTSPGLILLCLATAIGSSVTVLAAEPAFNPTSAMAGALTGAFAAPAAGALAAQNSVDRLAGAYRDLNAVPALAMILNNAASKVSIALAARATLPEMETTKFQAYYGGLEVVGAAVLHHRTA